MFALVSWVWAMLAGVSVPLQVGGTIRLNATPADRLQHSLYVNEACIFVGALWLALLSLVQHGERPQWPKRKWSWFGGLVVAPSFVTTPAASLLGTQLVLMLLLVGMIGAAITFDCMAGRFHLIKRKFVGLLLLVIGVGLELIDAIPEVQGNLILVLSYCVATLLSGCLFAVQAKMNKRLARDLGSTARAAACCNFSVLVWATPVWLILRFGMGIPFYFRVDDWWIWMLCGLQSAFYTHSLAELPKLIGYSVVFILVLAGKLVTAAFTDVIGAFSPPMPLSAFRCASVAAMVCGAVFYSMERSPNTSVVEPIGSFIESVHNFSGSSDNHDKALCADSVTERDLAELRCS